jgi:hypothetical protein
MHVLVLDYLCILTLLDPYKNLSFIEYPGEINATYEVSIVTRSVSIFAGSIYRILLFISQSFFSFV